VAGGRSRDTVIKVATTVIRSWIPSVDTINATSFDPEQSHALGLTGQSGRYGQGWGATVV
jgi:hypothetical protein